MIVVKIGGGSSLDITGILEDARDILASGEKLLFIHGANSRMKSQLRDLDLTEEFFDSPSGNSFRNSTAEIMKIFTQIYCGEINKSIVAQAIGLGVNAIGLSGIDGALLTAERKKVVLAKKGDKVVAIRDNFHGKITSVNVDLLLSLLEMGYTPFISVPAVTEKGEIVNIDNDTAAAEIMASLRHKLEEEIKFISLIEAKGLMLDIEDESSLIGRLTAAELEGKIDDYSGRIKRKLMGAAETLKNGVDQIYISDGRVENPLKKALAGEGTVIINS